MSESPSVVGIEFITFALVVSTLPTKLLGLLSLIYTNTEA